MKTRIIAAVVLIPVLLLLVLAAPKMIAAVIFAILMTIAAYELLYRTGLVRHARLVLYSCAMAFAVTMWSYAGALQAYAMLGLLVFCLLLFSEMMMDHIKVHFEMLALCFVAGVIIPYMLSALIRILGMGVIGRHVILVPFAVAFLSDGGAYFVGLRFGKHKLAPVVSPNKSIEGALGGVAAAMLGMLVYALILDLVSQFYINYGYAVLYGLAGSAAGVFGDLCFSVIKRQTGIKDYGNLIPGHGGVLDRFDSMVTVAPLMEVMILLLPLAV